MALTRTTLSSAYAVGDNQIVVASATGFVAGYIVRIDQEWFVVQKNYVSGTTLPVRGGQMGSKASAHVATCGVVVWPNPLTNSDEFDAPGPGGKVNNPIAGRARIIESITADNSTVTHTQAGTDHVVILNSTSVINLTIPVPTTDMDGDILVIIGNGIAAHLVTVTGGVGGVGGTADVFTFGTTQKQAIQLMAANATWQLLGPLSTATANVSGPALA